MKSSMLSISNVSIHPCFLGSPFFLLFGFAEGMRGGGINPQRENPRPKCVVLLIQYVAIPSTHIRIQSCGWLVDNNAVISRWLLTQCTCAPTALNCIDDACLSLRLYIYLILFDSWVSDILRWDLYINRERDEYFARVFCQLLRNLLLLVRKELFLIPFE